MTLAELINSDPANDSNGAITGWWLYRDGVSRLPEVVTALSYRRTVDAP